MKTIGLASDHAGFDLKIHIKNYLIKLGYSVIDFGCNSDQSCDYADFAHLLGTAFDKQEINQGFVFCGTGNGINMTVNKHQSIRSALCWNNNVVEFARHHNDANVCALPARLISEDEAVAIVDIFLNEPFDGGRHAVRIEKIPIKN